MERETEANLYGRTATQAANQEAIANRAYANRIGNGNIASGDGWRFRGRSLKHLTGRSNYRSFTNYHATFWSENINFENNPDLLATSYVYTVRSGVYFWLQNNLATIADQGSTDAVVDSITRIINRDTDSYGDRRRHFRRIYTDERIFENI